MTDVAIETQQQTDPDTVHFPSGEEIHFFPQNQTLEKPIVSRQKVEAIFGPTKAPTVIEFLGYFENFLTDRAIKDSYDNNHEERRVHRQLLEHDPEFGAEAQKIFSHNQLSKQQMGTLFPILDLLSRYSQNDPKIRENLISRSTYLKSLIVDAEARAQAKARFDILKELPEEELEAKLKTEPKHVDIYDIMSIDQKLKVVEKYMQVAVQTLGDFSDGETETIKVTTAA